MGITWFEQHFTALAGFPPFHWQTELFQRFIDNTPPQLVDLPTGAGKTSVMRIWLLALAAQVSRSLPITVPHRLVWVVDRRVVVDQATAEADAIACRLEQDDLSEPSRLLTGLSSTGKALAVSTLRGEHLDNRQWSQDPTCPAIIVGTVDMIGSRLLFSGYGDSRWRRPLHAGLLGQDTLIVNDEAHITPAFAALIQSVAKQTGDSRPLRVMLLSATHATAEEDKFPRSLDADLQNPESAFFRRYNAVKRLHLVDTPDKPARKIEELALAPHGRTLIYVRQPKQAREIAAAVEKATGARVAVIAGTQRGWERDNLLKNEIVLQFLSKDPPAAEAPPVSMVATSAGEVGIDLSADRLITDLETADHLLQRLGRLNRFGANEGEAYVVYSPKQTAGDRLPAPLLKATVEYLQALNGDASPRNLREHQPPPDAMTPKPWLAPLHPWHIDVWSMTSIAPKDWPSRPAVEPWLRGAEEDSPPETYVAWREETADLVRNDVSEDDLEDLFDCFPILAQERLKDYTSSLIEKLSAERYVEVPALLITAKGEIRRGELSSLLKNAQDAAFATLLLPPGTGALDSNGMIDWTKSADDGSISRYDVSTTDKRRKQKLLPDEQPKFPEPPRCVIAVPNEDGEEIAYQWLFWVDKEARVSTGPRELELSPHLDSVAGRARDLAMRLGFEPRIVEVFHWAGQCHDLGKDCELWQRAGNNRNLGKPLAKVSKLNGRALGGYRHELGSLLEAERLIGEADFTPEEQDLALHLIAAHHGRSRPNFDEAAADPQAILRSEEESLESVHRFGRLQKRYGAWQLAYFEAVFRCADMLASAGAPEMSIYA